MSYERRKAETRGSVFEHGCLAPSTGEPYVIARVRFNGSLKLYSYWAPVRWQLTPGDIVSVWVGEREGYKDVTVYEVSNTARLTSVRPLKSLSCIVSYSKAAPDTSTPGKTPDAVSADGTTTVDFKSIDFSEPELRVTADQDIYKRTAEHYQRHLYSMFVERYIGKMPELGMGYGADAVQRGIDAHKRYSAAITGKRITGIIFDELVDEAGLPSNIPKPKETTVDLKIKTITYVNEQDVSKLTADQLFSYINAAENEIRSLSTLVNKPKLVDKRIAELEAGIAALLAAADGEDAAPYKPVIEPTFRERLADTLPKTE